MVGFFAYFSYTYAVYSENTDRLETLKYSYFPVFRDIAANRLALYKIKDALNTASLAMDAEALKDADRLADTVHANFHAIAQNNVASALRARELDQLFSVYYKLAREMASSIINGDQYGARTKSLAQRMAVALRTFEDTQDAFYEYNYRKFTYLIGAAKNASSHAVKMGLIAAAVMVLIQLLGIAIARNLLQSIFELRNAALKIRHGNWNARVAVDSNDEIGELGQAFNEMALSLSTTTVSRDFVENIIGSMADALIVLDKHGAITRINAAAKALFGYAEEELTGRPLSSILDQDSELSRDSSHHETLGRTKNGRAIPVALAVSVLSTSQGEKLGAVVLAQDIGERKRAAQALQAKATELEIINKELEQFAYVVSHDLKAPLRAIANLSQWIADDLEETASEETCKQLALMRGRVVRMEGLINGILEYSRIGRTAVKLEDVDCGQLIDDIVDGMPVPPGFTLDISPNLPRFVTPRVQLGQVLANLISNAIKHNHRPDGRISVSVADLGPMYEFTVADNGPGIAPQFHHKIFVIFQTLTARDKMESTGIGLTVVKKIVETVGGNITLESDEGKGATFRFTWPKEIGRKSDADGLAGEAISA